MRFLLPPGIKYSSNKASTSEGCILHISSSDQNKNQVDKLTDFPRLNVTPLEPFDIYANSKQRRKNDKSFYARFLPFVMLWFSGPVEKGHYVLCHLGSCCWCSCWIHAV